MCRLLQRSLGLAHERNDQGFDRAPRRKSDFSGGCPVPCSELAGPNKRAAGAREKELRPEAGLNVLSGRRLKSDGSGIGAVELTQSVVCERAAQLRAALLGSAAECSSPSRGSKPSGHPPPVLSLPRKEFIETARPAVSRDCGIVPGRRAVSQDQQGISICCRNRTLAI